MKRSIFVLMLLWGLLSPFIGLLAHENNVMWFFWIMTVVSIIGLVTGNKRTFGAELLFAVGLGIWGDYGSFLEGFGVGLLFGDCAVTILSLILMFLGVIRK